MTASSVIALRPTPLRTVSRSASPDRRKCPACRDPRQSRIARIRRPVSRYAGRRQGTDAQPVVESSPEVKLALGDDPVADADIDAIRTCPDPASGYRRPQPRQFGDRKLRPAQANGDFHLDLVGCDKALRYRPCSVLGHDVVDDRSQRGRCGVGSKVTVALSATRSTVSVPFWFPRLRHRKSRPSPDNRRYPAAGRRHSGLPVAAALRSRRCGAVLRQGVVQPVPGRTCAQQINDGIQHGQDVGEGLTSHGRRHGIMCGHVAPQPAPMLWPASVQRLASRPSFRPCSCPR